MTSAELLATAAINTGRYAQAFPSFGPERRGAPVVAFCRISDEPIRIRANIVHPDYVLVLDPSILRILDVTQGLKDNGTLVTNTRYEGAEIKEKLHIRHRLATVNATRIAMETVKLPITNTTMLGALLRASQAVDKDALKEPFEHRFGRLAARNIEACHKAYQETSILER